MADDGRVAHLALLEPRPSVLLLVRLPCTMHSKPLPGERAGRMPPPEWKARSRKARESHQGREAGLRGL